MWLSGHQIHCALRNRVLTDAKHEEVSYLALRQGLEVYLHVLKGVELSDYQAHFKCREGPRTSKQPCDDYRPRSCFVRDIQMTDLFPRELKNIESTTSF